MTDAAQSLPPAAVLIRHTVADFDAWKTGFDEHEDVRRASGILGHHLNRAEDDPNRVTIFLAVADIDKAKAFAESDDLKKIMKEVGVTSAPEVTWMTPVREDVVWDRQLPAIIISHTVADFDRWLEGYDAADELRASGGIIGHAANRSLDDPSLAIVYHQAESFEALRAFVADPALRAVMDDAGVSSDPDISFHAGGWGKFYG